MIRYSERQWRNMAKSKRPVGAPPRPSKKSAAEIALTYLESCKVNYQIPYKEELAGLLDITDETLALWCKDDDELSATIKRIEDLQSYNLQKGGLEGKINTTMAIFLLKANHGKIETEKKLLGGVDGNNLEIKFVEEKFGEINE